MKLQPIQRRTWAIIDLDAAIYNFSEVKKKLKANTRLCCVVKANGYGHGAVQLSHIYEQLGADYLAVSNIEEAMQLRKAAIHIPILVLGYTDPRCADVLARNNITQCVFSYEYGRALRCNAKNNNVVVKVHIKIDTGMGRIGFTCETSELDKVVEVCSFKAFDVEGVFTHFSSADEGNNGKDYTIGQFTKFMDAIHYLYTKGVSFPIRHCANSAGILDYPEMQLDMVRAGIVLYGLQPSGDLQNPGLFKPILELKTIIDHIKIVHAGDFISYGREYKANHNMIVGTIPIGYADGIWRSNYQNHMVVEVEGKLAPIIGRVCMDQCMIELTDIPKVSINSTVTVYGVSYETSVDHVAEINNTINYEIICALGERVPRVYKENGKTIAVVDNII